MPKSEIEVDQLRAAIANQMRIQRVIRRWSQDDLAQHSGMGRSTILRLEKERIDMNTNHLQALAAAFEMPWIKFLELVNTGCSQGGSRDGLE